MLKSTKKTPISFELQASYLALQICLSDIVGIKNDVICLRGREGVSPGLTLFFNDTASGGLYSSIYIAVYSPN